MATYTKDEIKQFYDNGEFKKAYDGSIEMINEFWAEDDTADSKVFLIATNSWLRLLDMNLNENEPKDDRNQFYTLCIATMDVSESTEKYYENYRAILSEFYIWTAECFNLIIDNALNNPGDGSFDIPVKFYNYVYLMEDEINRCCQVCRINFETSEPTNKFEFSDKYDNEYIYSVKQPDYYDVLFSLASFHFSSTSILYENLRGTKIPEFAQKLSFELNDNLSVIEAYIEDYDLFKNTCVPLLQRLETLVQVKTLFLNATIMSNGYPVSIIQILKYREKRIDEIKALNNEILKLDPNYKPLELPRLEPYLPHENNLSNGCYVATAVYGSYDCPEVWTLRRYRDDMLAKTWHGRLFIYLYYAISPTIVRLFGNTMWFKNMWRGKLDKKVKQLQNNGVESTPYNDKNWRKEK